MFVAFYGKEQLLLLALLCHGDAGGRECVLYPDHLSAEALFAALQTYI